MDRYSDADREELAQLRRALCLSPRALALLALLALDLEPAVYKRVLALLREVDDHSTALTLSQEAAHWARLKAHLPGLAPMLDVMYHHVRGDAVLPACRDAGGQCRLDDALPQEPPVPGN